VICSKATRNKFVIEIFYVVKTKWGATFKMDNILEASSLGTMKFASDFEICRINPLQISIEVYVYFFFQKEAKKYLQKGAVF
jgi:hypothetical protein